jgi:hypothetical protein
MTLEWGNPVHMAAARSSLLMRVPDVVLAADVVYTAAARQSLFRTLAEIMSPPGASNGDAAELCASATSVVADANAGRGHSRGAGTVAYLGYEERPGVEELPELCRRHGLVAEEVRARAVPLDECKSCVPS